jgi:hypothetical protein
MADFKVTWRRAVYVLDTAPGNKVVLLALSEYADWNTHASAHPGVKRLMRDTGASTSTVKRALALGVASGLLEQKVSGHNGAASSYNLTLKGVATEPVQASRVSPASTKGVTSDPPPTPTPTQMYRSQDVKIAKRAESVSTEACRPCGVVLTQASRSVHYNLFPECRNGAA